MENVPVDDFKNLASPYSVDNFEVQISVCLFTYNTAGDLTGYNDGMISVVYDYDDLNRKISEIVTPFA